MSEPEKKRKHFDGYHVKWYASKIEVLDRNEMGNSDMAWKIHDNLFWDARHVYSEQSDYFKTLFSTTMTRDIKTEDGLPVIPVSGYMQNIAIFRMIRIFCHTGTLEVSDGDSVENLLDFYFASDCYFLEGPLQLLHTMLVNQLSPTNVLKVYEILLKRPSEGRKLEQEVEDYIATYAFAVLKHKSFQVFPIELMGKMCAIFQRETLNILEKDLLWYVYLYCKHHASVTETSTPSFATPMDMMMYKWDEGSSLWGCIRVKALTQDDISEFVYKNPDALDDSDTVNILNFLYVIRDSAGSVAPQIAIEAWKNSRKMSLVVQEMCTSLEPRFKFHVISCYPRNLQLYGTRSPQTSIVYWDVHKFKAFVAIQYDSGPKVSLDPILFCKSYFHLELSHYENSIHIKGRAHPDQNSIADSSVSTVKIAAKIVNFKHDRWKDKHTIVQLKRSEVSNFAINSILTMSTVEKVKKKEDGDSTGYLFEIANYPQYKEGNWMLVLISIETI
jgi:hypothetical protein